MRKDRLMNKSVKQAEKETGASPYKKRCGESTLKNPCDTIRSITSAAKRIF